MRGVRSVWVNRQARPWPEGHRPAHAEIGGLHELEDVLRRIHDARE